MSPLGKIMCAIFAGLSALNAKSTEFTTCYYREIITQPFYEKPAHYLP